MIKNYLKIQYVTTTSSYYCLFTLFHSFQNDLITHYHVSTHQYDDNLYTLDMKDVPMRYLQYLHISNETIYIYFEYQIN